MTVDNHFSTIAERRFLGVPDGAILSWCPSMDLLTISMNKMSLWVYRLNGQRVYSVNNKAIITGITWKPDGKLFCLSGVDGQCKVYDSNTGKLIVVLTDKDVTITNKAISSVNWCHRESEVASTNKFDKLFDIDITKSLPKPPPLQNTLSENLFTSKLAIDDIDQSDDSAIDFLILCYSSNKISITLYGLFTINNISMASESEHLKFIAQCSTSTLENHFFVARDDQKLLLIQLEATFTSKFGSYLPHVTLASSKILAILGYIKESISLLSTDCKGFTDLLGRYLNNLKDEVSDSGESDEIRNRKVISNLYDLLLTGTLDDSLKDFLVDQLGERGVKKLFKAGNSCYDSIRRICFYQLVTSLERTMVILNSLKGLAEWEDRGKQLGLNPDYIKTTMRSASEFLRSIYTFIWKINKEQKLFNTFIDWLSFCIEETFNEDEPKKDFKGKIGDLTVYFNDYLMKSTIFTFLEIEHDDSKIAKQYLVSSYKELNQNCCSVFNAIEESMKKQVKIKNPVVVTSFMDDAKVSMKIVENYCFVLFYNDGSLNITRFSTSDVSVLENVSFKVPEFKVIKAEFLDDKELMILGKQNEHRRLIAFDYISLNYTAGTLQSFKEGRERIFEDDFKPEHLTVNGNKGRRIGCLLGENRQNYMFFDVDDNDHQTSDEDEEDDDNGDDEDDEDDDDDIMTY